MATANPIAVTTDMITPIDGSVILTRNAVSEEGAFEILAAITRLRQICCDPELRLKEQHAYGSGKLELLLDKTADLLDSGLILSGGTAYLTDAGMTGVIDSVLGVSVESATYKMRTGLPVRFEHPEGDCAMQGVIVETDTKTGKAVSIERFSVE